MNWKVWTEIETFLLQRQLKPLLAVVPDNRDPSLQVDPPTADFWDRVRGWQDRGWTIALHGFQHRYVIRNAGIVALRKKSEFAGLPAEEQRQKLQRGVEILERERIKSQVWIAPGDTFDTTTVKLLPEFGIRVISAGYFRFPYVSPNRITWVPQQLYRFRPAPPGVWTVCYHHNQWTASQARTFTEDVDRYGANIVSLADVLDESAGRESNGTAWLCTRPRLSRFLIRSELKLWGWWSAGRRRCQCPCIDADRLAQPSK
jgi:peptidoglycan/xylan/chitin deacetylase (PgdA/CDA1 family)